MALVNQNGKMIKRKMDLLDSSKFSIIDFKLACLNKKIYLYTQMCDKNHNAYNFIKKFDENLKFLSEIRLDFEINSWCIYDNKIYFLYGMSNFLYTYDRNTDEIKKIGQESQDLPFYIPKTVSKLGINENFYVLLDNKTIKLMKKSDGLISKTFPIEAKDFSLYLDKYILKYLSNTSNMILYDLDGNKISDNKLDFLENSKLFSCTNEALVFFNFSSYVLDYFKI